MNKSKFHNLLYSYRNNGTPHGNLISQIYYWLRKYQETPENIIMRSINSGEKVLDMGCGEGSFVYRLSKKCKFVYGMDIADTRIKKAKKKYRKLRNIEFKIGDFDSRLPYKNDMFDTVISITSFQFCFDPYFTLHEINRILKQGGVLIIQVTNLAWFVYRLRLLFGKQIFTSLAYRKKWDGGVLHYFTYDSLRELLEENGFKCTRKDCSGVLSIVKRIYPPLLASDIIVWAEKK